MSGNLSKLVILVSRFALTSYRNSSGVCSVTRCFVLQIAAVKSSQKCCQNYREYKCTCGGSVSEGARWLASGLVVASREKERFSTRASATLFATVSNVSNSQRLYGQSLIHSRQVQQDASMVIKAKKHDSAIARTAFASLHERALTS